METPAHAETANPRKALLGYPEAQEYLGGISRSTLKTLVGNGALRAIAINRRRLFPIGELDRYIATCLAEASGR